MKTVLIIFALAVACLILASLIFRLGHDPLRFAAVCFAVAALAIAQLLSDCR